MIKRGWMRTNLLFIKPAYLPIFWLALAFCLWNYLSLGTFSISGSITLLSITFFSVLLGDVFWTLVLKRQAQWDYLTFKLLVGLLLGNCLLFLFSVVLPFGLIWDWIILIGLIFLLNLRTRRPLSLIFAAQCTSEKIVLLLLPLITTWWAHQLLQPPYQVGDEIRFWGSSDVLTHMAQLGVQSRGYGLGSMSDFMMAGAPLHPYHFASYLFPALIAKTENYASLAAYSSFLLPVGILILGLGAYALGRSLFGPNAGLVAGLGVLLVPDPFQQGFGNLFLGQSYWLMQSIPAMPYGVAACALVFIFLFDGFRTQSWRWIVVSYGFVLVTLLYKAHLFVAISWPALILPALLMGDFSKKTRALGVVALTLVFFACMHLSQLLPSMPTLQLNGSGFADYTHWLTQIQAPGSIKTIVTLPRVQEHGRTYLKILAFSMLVLLCSIGIAFFIYPLLMRKLLKEKPLYIALFPYIVGAIYLVMALGFALETRGIGEAEELQHRPFIWAYFVFTVWTLAGSYWFFCAHYLPTMRTKVILIGIGCCLLLVPWRFSAGVQNLEVEGGLVHIPLCQYQVAQYLSSNSEPDQLIQDSTSNLVLSALSGRQNWLALFYRRLPAGYSERKEQLKNILQSSNANEITQFMRSKHIRYFIAEPGTLAQWNQFYPESIVYKCQGYRVFQFK
jgi:hypothetical protein